MPTSPHTSPSVVELPGPWEHVYLHTRGLRLHAAVAGNPHDPLIVCLHGSTGGWFDYREVLAPLAARGFYVAALDLRGFGMSDKPPVDPGQDIRALIGDVAGAITALGHEDAIVLGNDTGATLAWAVAGERPERVRGVVSISGAHAVDLRRCILTHPWDFTWILGRAFLVRLPMPLVLALPYPLAVRLDVTLNSVLTGPELAECVRLRQLGAGIDNTRRGAIWNHRLLTAAFGTPSSTVDAPVLFIHADQALWGPVLHHARRRAARLVAQHIPGTKNLPHLEAPAQFVDRIAEWARAI